MDVTPGPGVSETSELHRQLLASLEAHLRSRSKVDEARTQDRGPGEALG